jgi:hypothetical protein
MFKNIGQYSKFIVAVLGAVGVGITTFGHNAPWTTTALSVIAAVSVYLVPNKQPIVPATPVSKS